MNGRRLEIFKIFGIPIRVDLSWLLILFLVVYSLAGGYFPANHPGLPSTAYWAMGFVAAIGLFLSILFHELAHSLMARHYQIKIDGITLFIFGGVAEFREESASPKVEFWVAVMGPVASMVLALLFFFLSRIAESYAVNRGLILIFYYLGFMNMVLAIFNILPAFPLDGGRIFRSALWAFKKDFVWAARIAAKTGEVFAWILVGLGGLRMLRGDPMGGIWYLLIGFFLRRASKLSWQQAKIQGQLEALSIEQVLEESFVQFHPDDRLVDVMAVLESRNLHTQYPVLDGGRLQGFLPILKLEALHSPGWEFREVSEFTNDDVESVTVSPEMNVWQVFQKMRAGSWSSLFVVDQAQQMQGLVSMEKILRCLDFPLATTGNPKAKHRNQEE